MAESEIEVWATRRSSRDKWVLRWKDPITGRIRQKTCIASSRRQADKEAGALQTRLNSPIPINTTTGNAWSWDDFCAAYRDAIKETSESNRGKWNTVATEADQVFKSDKVRTPMLAHIDLAFIRKVRQRLIDHRGNASSTADSGIATFRSALNYAAGKGWMAPLPAEPRDRGRKEQDDKEMRGRPITGEEFERMLKLVGTDAVTETKKHPDTWKTLLNGIWLSGLRISEAMMIHTNRMDCHRPVNLDTASPRIIFLCSQKNRKTQRVALTREFAQFLRTIKPDEDGWIFSPRGNRGRRYRTPKAVGRVVSAIGEAAGIITEPGETPEYASAHDLRRAFARRWSGRVMPPTLMHLMRHGSIETTMKYYVGSDADAAATAMYEVWEKRQMPAHISAEEIHNSLQ